MNCKELAALLLEFTSGDLAEDCCQDVKEHLCRCPSCDAYVKSYKITITITRSLPPKPMPNQLAMRLKKALEDMDRQT